MVDKPPTNYWEFIEPAHNAVSIYDGPKRFDVDAAEWPHPVQHLLAVNWCNSEVCNGGFAQFFSNSTGVLAPQALEGFCAIGRPDLADLLKAAMDVFGNEYPRERAIRETLLDRLPLEPDPFRALEDKYYELEEEAPGRPCLYDVMEAYFRGFYDGCERD